MSAESQASASQLRWERVGVRLGERAVLDEVSFSLSRGEIVGLLGRNGAGKTTVVRATNRSVELAAGQILMDERPLSDQADRDLARQIASVPQDMHVPFRKQPLSTNSSPSAAQVAAGSVAAPAASSAT